MRNCGNVSAGFLGVSLCVFLVLFFVCGYVGVYFWEADLVSHDGRGHGAPDVGLIGALLVVGVDPEEEEGARGVGACVCVVFVCGVCLVGIAEADRDSRDHTRTHTHTLTLLDRRQLVGVALVAPEGQVHSVPPLVPRSRARLGEGVGACHT